MGHQLGKKSSIRQKSVTRYGESYSIGDAQCSECGKQENISLSQIGDKELCPPCAKMARKKAAR